MFTGKDLQDIIQSELEDTPDDADMVRHINSCLIEHYRHFRKTGTQEITATDDFIDRTDGHLDILRVTDTNGFYVGRIELSEDRTQIKFADPGTYTVVSLVIPTLISDVSDTVDVNDIFKVGIARYAGAMYFLMDNDQADQGKVLKLEADTLIKNTGAALAGADRRTGIRAGYTRSGANYHEQG